MSSASAIAVLASIGLVGCGVLRSARRETPHERLPSLVVAGTELVLRNGSGREWRSADLRGAILDLGDVSVRIDDVMVESKGRDRRVTLHRVTAIDDAGAESELCEPDSSGERWAIPITDVGGQVELVCTSGAIGKCVRWGYGTSAPSSRSLHDACVRMVRADYGGDGQSATRDGERIEFCDRVGIHPCREEYRQIEAAWSSTGAICVARVRVAELARLGDLAVRYPPLAGRVGEASCTFSAALADPRVELLSRRPLDGR